jgi:hypothetical protein
MNVYLYGGSSRLDATNKIVNENQQPEKDTNYTIAYKSGMLLIAYPNENENSEFIFEYWIDGYDPSIWVKLIAFLKTGNNWLVVLLAFLLLVYICISLCCFCRRKKQLN